MEELKHPDVAAIFERLLRELGISGNQLAVALGTSQQAISNYTSGRNKPGREIMAAIVQRYPAINAAWLLTGEGDPFPEGRYNEKPAASLAHGRAHGEARATAHPTVQPTEKELPNAPATGPYLHDDDPVLQQLLIRIAEKDRIIERQQEDIEAWRDAFRKPLASAHAATPYMSLSPTATTPIGPRFDEQPVNMWLNRDAA